MFYTHANLECLWCRPFGAKIVYTITWRIAFLTWTKSEEWPFRPGQNQEITWNFLTSSPELTMTTISHTF